MKGFGRLLFLVSAFFLAPVIVWAGNPYQQAQTIYPVSPVAQGFFGNTVSLSTDSQTALIGQGGSNKVLVFQHSSGHWIQGSEFDDPGTSSNDSFGEEVALSGDGKTALVCSVAGFVYVYSSANGAWTHVTTWSNPLPSGSISFCQDGREIALSADGSTAVVGLPEQTVSGLVQAGTLYIYTSQSGTWSTPKAITEPTPVTGGNFGTGVALSSDGKSVLIGKVAGISVYLFTSSGGTWTLSHTFDDPGTGGANDTFGYSVALSADGTRAVVTAPFTAGGGTAYMFTQTAGTWGNPQAFDDATHKSGYFGEESGFSGDGNTAFFIEEFSGRVFYTQYSSGVWSALTEIVDLPSDQIRLVSISGDGSTVLIGSPGLNYTGVSQAGEVFAYVPGGQTTGGGSGGTGSGGTGYSSGGGGTMPPVALMLLAWVVRRRRFRPVALPES